MLALTHSAFGIFLKLVIFGVQFDAEGLTLLGREMLLGKEELEKQEAEIEELKSKLASTQVKIEELNLKIKERRLVFSGEVYLRH